MISEALEAFSSDEEGIWQSEQLPWKCNNTLDRHAMYEYIKGLKETNA